MTSRYRRAVHDTIGKEGEWVRGRGREDKREGG